MVEASPNRDHHLLFDAESRLRLDRSQRWLAFLRAKSLQTPLRRVSSQLRGEPDPDRGSGNNARPGWVVFAIRNRSLDFLAPY